MKLQRRIKTVQSFFRQRRCALQFDQLPDPRDRRGRRWTASALFSAAVMSLMMIARSLRGAERLTEELSHTQENRGLTRRVPDSTLGDFLAQVDPAPLRQHLHRLILDEHRRKALEPTGLPIRAIAVDGKTLATLDHAAHPDCQEQSTQGGPPTFVFRVLNTSLISSQAAVCIDQRPIPADTNETGIFPSLFAELECTYGRTGLYELLSMDAGLASEENARLIDTANKAYWIALKGNQPTLHAEVQRILGPLALRTDPEAQTDWELDSSRGWIRRQLWRSHELAGFEPWTHLRQVILVRVLQAPGSQSGAAPVQGPVRILEERLFVTNLVRGRLTGAEMLKLVRAHWHIENKLHGTLDIQWKEDQGFWVHRGHGLPVVGLLRAIAYNMLALLRSVHLRTVEARAASWQQLRDWIRDAFLHPSMPDGQELEASAVTL